MTLGRKIVYGGGWLVFAHVSSSIVAVFSALAYARIISVVDFAVFVLCGSFADILRVIGRAGANARLLTKPSSPSNIEYEAALGLMLVASLVAGIVFITLLPLIGMFSNIPNIFWPGFVSAVQIPIYVAALPAICRIEKKLEYGVIAKIELMSQVVGIVVGLTISYIGLGIWGPIFGALMREICHTTYSWTHIGLIPRVRWNKRYSVNIIRFGFYQSIATVMAQGRNSVFLVLVSYFFGQAAVGYIGMSQRTAHLLTPIRAAMSRIMLPIFSGLKSSPDYFRAIYVSTNESELLLSIPVAVVASYFYTNWAVLIFGNEWLPTVFYFPWVVAASIIQSIHGIELSALHACRKFSASAIVSIAIYFTTGLALLVISMFTTGMPAIAAVAVWPAYFLQDYFCIKILDQKINFHKYLWGGAGMLGCLSSLFGSWWLLVSCAIFFITRSRVRACLNAFFK